MDAAAGFDGASEAADEAAGMDAGAVGGVERPPWMSVMRMRSATSSGFRNL
jgi:hypothetical protein